MTFKNIHVIINPAAGKQEPILDYLNEAFLHSRSKLDSWQKFTDKFISNVHSLTVAEMAGNSLAIRQISADGK